MNNKIYFWIILIFSFIYLDKGKYEIVDGELKNYFVEMIDVKIIKIFNDKTNRIFSRVSYVPTIINE